MRHQNTALYAILKQIPRGALDRLAREHGIAMDERDLTAWQHLIVMLVGQLMGAQSLRELEAVLRSHAGALYHVGVSPVARSTLAEANRHRTAALFVDLFGLLVAGIGSRKLRRDMKQAVRLIDATVLPLSGLSRGWASFSSSTCGAKAHVVYDPDADRPLYVAVTPANVNDITAAKEMPIEPGAIYVFDLGYYDYGWWAKLHDAMCTIVTRLKTNTQLTVQSERVAPVGASWLTDRVGHLPARQASSRKNPMRHLVREVRVRIDNGTILRLLTNDLTASAEEIAALYKRRWAIELFFRWIKQTLRIRHFYGRSENAVRIQIAVAFTAFVLLRMAQKAAPIVESPLTFARVVRVNLMHRRPIERLLSTAPPTPPDTRQGCLALVGSAAPPSHHISRTLAVAA